ncbi:phosphotransferase family enzyme [Roseimicrobium gellanilyticum]|uniref:Phosphotransferase family enzyme n=1 Tax=Roseimicrobium gellanilyticum TaxID=748857 RepID=A0A366HIU7_9BACT|nr:phosphotransferase [Roseimicrobium gellanilyticum]RBP42676.1 phosphotransferase family enzyme [Roseimicrobium gellanilyticum]
MSERDTALPIRAATEVLAAYGVIPDRCDILQNGHTLVLRLTEDLVARVVQDVDGPRQGTEWFERENAVAQHLTEKGAPVISLHDGLPSGPHEHLGYPMNFWKFVTSIDAEPNPEDIGRTLHQCHEVLRSCAQPLPKLAIMTESLALLDTLTEKNAFPEPTLTLLRAHLTTSLEVLDHGPHQPLHGDAHMGNLMNTTIGLLWSDWEDTFCGPVEWDIASVIWNAKILEEDYDTTESILTAYRQAGGQIDETLLQQSLIARAAVMTAWYPVLYPNPNAERQSKLQRRVEWLEKMR